MHEPSRLRLRLSRREWTSDLSRERCMTTSRAAGSISFATRSTKLAFPAMDTLPVFRFRSAAVDQLGVLPEDNEGIIDHLRSVEGVVAAVFFEELPEGRVRISARSKDPRVDVCEICKLFGGGGHPLAAGARVRGTIAEVEEKFLEAVCHEIRNRN